LKEEETSMKEKDERFEHKYVIIPENPCEEI
jgi:hypothetical protein